MSLFLPMALRWANINVVEGLHKPPISHFIFPTLILTSNPLINVSVFSKVEDMSSLM